MHREVTSEILEKKPSPITNTRDLVLMMVHNQDDLNRRTAGKDWATQSLKWYRAAWTEAGEASDYCAWYWWKKATVNVEQLRLELVDIFHFLLSDYFAAYGDELTASLIAGEFVNLPIKRDDTYDGWEPVTALIEQFVAVSIVTKRVDLVSFRSLCMYCHLELTDLFKYYFGKSALNFFRQENGYKSGEYIKNWSLEDGVKVEDNEVLYRIIADIPMTEVLRTDYQDRVKAELTTRYEEVKRFNSDRKPVATYKA